MLSLKYLVIPFILITTCYSPHVLSAMDSSFIDSYNAALKYYKAGQYTDSESKFSESTGYRARLGQAISAFHLKKVKKSLSLFKQSVLLAGNDNDRYTSLYNAATCSFLMADYFSASQLFSDAQKYKLNDKNSIQFAKLSAYLSKLVLAQIARDNAPSKKKKSSEGKKTISSVDFVFDDDINLRIEDGDSSESTVDNQQKVLLADKAFLESLIAAGVESIKIKDNGDNQQLPSVVDLDIIYEFSSLESASYTPPASIPDLWKRIFELEKGYPASLEKAETVPGVRPW